MRDWIESGIEARRMRRDVDDRDGYEMDGEAKCQHVGEDRPARLGRAPIAKIGAPPIEYIDSSI